MTKKEKTNECIKSAIAITGTATKLAIACDVSCATVTGWLYDRFAISAEHAIAIEYAVKGAISRREIRPDIRWNEVKKRLRR